MKRKWSAVLPVLFYLFFLSKAWGFEIARLLDGKLFVQLLIGAVLLTIPFYQKGIKWEGLLSIFGKKALEAGYIQTFLLLFICLSEEELKANMMMHFRPVLYGFCIFLLFMPKEDKEKEQEEQKKQEEQELKSKEKLKSNSEERGVLSFDESLDAFEKFRQEGLTKRETEIALLICKGCSNREIAEEFVISETTVKKHVSNIFEKTGIEKREELKKLLER